MRFCAAVCCLSSGLLLAAEGPRTGVDLRVELMSILFRLAGNPEYNQGRVGAYDAAIERHFGPFREHEAVRMARELCRKDGVSFDAVMSMAIHLKDAVSLAERVPFDSPQSKLEGRWHGVKARTFLAAARRFAAEARFAEFAEAQRPLYHAANARLRAMVGQSVDVAWFEKFFGMRAGARLMVVPGLVNGGASYGPSLTAEDGVEESYAIIGVSQVDGEGNPVFPVAMVDTLVHEFAHSYVNPPVYRFRARLEKAAARVYAAVEAAMRAQAYGEPLTMAHESLVRAATVRYALAHRGAGAAAEAAARERARSFLWTGEVVELLGEYEKNRAAYPDFERFMPRVAEYFEDLAPRAAAMAREFGESRPRVASMEPPNGSADVDPARDRIVVRFDRAMRKTQYSVMFLRKELFPKVVKAAFDETGTVFTLEVQLEPGRAYEFGLNGPGGGNFASREGVPLAHVAVRFRTRATAPAPAAPR